MEEHVGGWWDKLIRKAAETGYVQHAVKLSEVQHLAPVFFRAMGGNPALTVRSTVGTEHQGRRTLLQKVAGTGQSVELAWSNRDTLFLPETIDWFPSQQLNRDAYLWLLALSAYHAHLPACRGLPWLQAQQFASYACLKDMPGLRQLYQALVQVYLPQRKVPLGAKAEIQATEQAIVQALQNPEQPSQFVVESLEGIMPVHLWVHPQPPRSMAGVNKNKEAQELESHVQGHAQDLERKRRFRVRQVQENDQRNGPLIIFRAESIFTWDNFLNMNRHDDDEEPGDLRAADDMEEMAVAKDTKRRASRFKFDLDLPSSECDDIALDTGIRLPEWHYKKGLLQPNQCLVQTMLPKNASASALPEHLRQSAQKLKRQFQALRFERQRLHGQPDGDELDIDRVVRHFSDVCSGVSVAGEGLYLQSRCQQRSLSTLVLADVSLSTDAWIGKGAKASNVISVIRDSLMLMGEALTACGDDYALYGFSSLRRTQVRMLKLKGFDENYDEGTRGRIAALVPGYYTRMGAAIRYCTEQLKDRPSQKRLLLIVTDGKPNDLDHYEGRFGLEDTRHAVLQAREVGLIPFCVTIDREAGEYLPHLFGHNRYVVVREATRLPVTLTHLYTALRQ